MSDSRLKYILQMGAWIVGAVVLLSFFSPPSIADRQTSDSANPILKGDNSGNSDITPRLRSSSATDLSLERQCAPRYEGCNLKSDVGIPTVLISQGRSGSSAIWDIMSGLVSPSVQVVREDPGHGPDMITRFMTDKETSGHCWLVNVLCKYQLNLVDSLETKPDDNGLPPLYGTKWKPYLPGFNMTAARAALKWIANEAPYVKVVYSERNPLDVQFSRIKHAIDVGAHCEVTDVECIARHQQVAAHTHIPIETLLSDLEDIAGTSRKAREIMDRLHVPHVVIDYEKLFFDDTADEWKRTVDFLLEDGNGKQQRKRRFNDITQETVKSVMQFASTSSGNRSASVANYDEVVKTLLETKFEPLLYK